MNTFTTRSIATTAVAGLLVLGGAPMASADDSRQENRQESLLGGPIELGGIQLGSKQDNSSSSSSSSTDSNDDEREARRSAERETSSRDVGLGVGDLRIDPRASSLQESSSSSEDEGEDRSSRSTTDLAGSLGIEFDGVSGFAASDGSSAAGIASEESDGDGAEAQRSTSEQERSIGGAFDTGSLQLRPGGSFLNDSASDSQDDGDDSQRQQRSVLDLGAPFSYEGGTYVLDFFSSDSNQEQSIETDEDGTETDGSSSSEERSETIGGQLEGGQGDPGLTVDSEDLQLQDD